MSSDLILVGDVGGTNSRLKLFEVAPGATFSTGGLPPGKEIEHKEYLNGGYENFTAIAEEFLAGKTVAAACIAVAGPVEGNKVTFTNRNWTVDGTQLQAALKIEKVRLVNDFVANGYGLLTLNKEKECRVLQKGSPSEGAPIACVGAGTGLGECFSTAAEPGAAYETFASEGGHAEFAPRDDVEMELLVFLKKKFSQKHRVSVERVISGPGLANVYEFLSTKYSLKVNKAVHSEFLKAGDFQGRVVATSTSKCALCEQAMQIFLGAYGSEVGVACLKWIPRGGMFVAGGLTPKNIDRITEGGVNSGFMKAFYDKGRVSPILKDIPLYAVMVEDIGQRGAHLVAFKQLQAVWRERKIAGRVVGGWKSATDSSTRLVNGNHKSAEASPLKLAALALAAFAIGFAVAKRR